MSRAVELWPPRLQFCFASFRPSYGWPDVQLIENLGFSTNILDYRSKIQDFQLIIQDFQLEFDNLGLSIRKTWIITLINQDFRFFCTLHVENLGFSIDNPSYSTHFWKSWIINLKILDFQIIGHLATKIQDFQLIIQVYRLDFDNLWLSIRKTWIFTLIIQVFRLIVQEKSKILDYRMKIQDFQRHMSNKSNILDYRYRLII